MKIKELIKQLEQTIKLGNTEAEVRIDFGTEEDMKEYSSKFGVSFDDLGDCLIYEVAE